MSRNQLTELLLGRFVEYAVYKFTVVAVVGCWSVRTPCVVSVEHILAWEGPPEFCALFWTIKRRKCRVSTDHSLIRCATRGAIDNGIIKKIRGSSVFCACGSTA